MKFVVMTVTALVVLGCNDRQSEPTGPMSIPVYTHGAASSPDANGGNFGTPLSGAEEVPANDSRARGNSIFQLSEDGESVAYKLIVANIENVIMAHIHIGPAGTNGPVVVWLYPSTAPGVQAPAGGGRIQGPIADGEFTSANLVLTNTTRALLTQQLPEGSQPESANDRAFFWRGLLAAVRNGNAYVNVHTNDGDATTPPGAPGDLPGGEVRGQLEHRGH